MARSIVTVVLLLTALLTHVNAATQCAWLLPRANVIRGTLYVDGGALWSVNGSDGPTNNQNVEGLIYSLNFSQPFNTNDSKIDSQPGGAAHNIAPNYIDGAMFSDDYEYALYGQVILSRHESDPYDNEFLEYYEYRSDFGAYVPNFIQGYAIETITPGTTRYITSGAAVSVPSEQLGFYFSGMEAPEGGPIWQNGTANTTATTLITVDMTNMGAFNFTNSTLPESIPGRANAELVWVPVSPKGVLVAIGGVINPEVIFRDGPNGGLTPSQKQESQKTSPTFMSTVSIYDIESGQWYQQNTTANGPSDMPPQLTQFCSVVATANDSSSYNIYIYGGYAGLDSDTDIPSDDVYVLSLPTFTWIRAYSGDDTKGRYGHRCVQPYPDQMFVVGGYGVNSPETCVSGGTVQVFNLNTVSFQDTYDPQTWSYYEVPSIITKVIGGDGKGGATNFAPQSWGDSALSGIFSSNYTGTAPKQWFPYAAQANNPSTPTPVAQHSGGGVPSWVGPVLGVVLGLVFLSAVAVAWMLWRRRKNMRRQSSQPSEPSSRGGHRNPIVRWLNGMPPPNPPKPDTTVTSSEVGDNEKPQSPIASPVAEHPNAFEMGGAPRFEVHGASAAVELPTNFNTTVPTSPSSPHSLFSSTTGLPSPVSPAQIPHSRGSSPTPDLSNSPSQLPSRNSSHPHRPTHTRNFSSLSSGVDLPPSVTDEEDQRRSQYLAELPSPHSSGSPVSPDQHLSVNSMAAGQQPHGARPARQGKSQSSFGEMLDEGDEQGGTK